MRNLFFIFAILSVPAFADNSFKLGDRVFDSRNYQAGTITRVLERGAYEVRLDKNAKVREYSEYYAAELNPKQPGCDKYERFCEGQHFIYKLPFIGQDRDGVITEIFQGKKTVYAVQLEGEDDIRFLNSDHIGYMVPTVAK